MATNSFNEANLSFDVDSSANINKILGLDDDLLPYPSEKSNSSGKSTPLAYDIEVQALNLATTQANISLDVDGNNLIEANRDGLLIYGYLNVRNIPVPSLMDQLASNFADPNGTRTTGSAIKTFLDQGLNSMLDVDGNGVIEANRDGLLAYGYLNVRNIPVPSLMDQLASNFADSTGTRITGIAIKTFLDGYLAPPSGTRIREINLSDLNGSNGFILNGIDNYDHSGGSVSSAGDINGDGFDDIIIGAWSADPNGQSYAGESYVVFGKAGGFTAQLNLSTLDGTNGFILNGIDRGYPGPSVSSAGDINGDGFDDLLIGASEANININNIPDFGIYDAGKSYVVFGKAMGFTAQFDLSSLDGTNGFIINGIDADDASGWSVSSAGDVNGDGFDDLIIGAWTASPNENIYAGESYVVFGKAEAFTTQLNLSDLNGSNGFIINGIDSVDFSGWSVSSAGDVNGDGFADLIIGTPNADPSGQTDAGESYVVFGKAIGFTAQFDLSTLNGSNGFIINGIDADDYSGNSVSSAGDINGDGFDDLIIGAYWADPNGQDRAGESYVVFGKADGFTSQLNLSDLNGSNGFIINGIDANDRSGRSVSSVGDINGDGFDDLIIGASGANPNGQNYAGESYVVFGGSQFAIPQANRPPIIEDQDFTLNENSPNGTVVGSVVASDPDNNSFTYSLVGTNSAFAINANTGQITVTDRTKLDFETTSRFSLRVKVTDSGNLADIATITIKLNDLPG